MIEDFVSILTSIVAVNALNARLFQAFFVMLNQILQENFAAAILAGMLKITISMLLEMLFEIIE
jgi:hypothetical protein